MEKILKEISAFFANLGSAPALTSFWSGLWAGVGGAYTAAVRWVLPVLAAVILIRCVLPALRGNKAYRPWGYLGTPGGEMLPLTHWENSIGRSRLSDIVLNMPFISRSHAVLSYDRGDWFIYDLGTKGGVRVNGEKVDRVRRVAAGDAISLAGLTLNLFGPDAEPDDAPPKKLRRAGTRLSPFATMLMIALFQMLACLQMGFVSAKAVQHGLPVVIAVLICAEYLHCLIFHILKYPCELELLAYFLCGVGLLVTASAAPASLYKELAAILIGVALYSVFLYLLSNPDRAQKLGKALLAAAVLLMLLNLVIGQVRNGARNWIGLGALTFQPMEFVKVAFVAAGTATLDRLLTTRNLTAYIVFTGACIATLAVTRDFGTALVFFCAFLIMAFMRSGDIRTIALIAAGAAVGAFAVVSFMPYVSARFSVWGHVWQHADSTGYQQTRTMIGAASGGLLGTGGGTGYLCKIAAADTDLVFGVICEEWGLLIAVTAVLCILFFAVCSLWAVRKCRSSLYAIAACGASTIFLTQAALNVFGSFDLLPLTGVTFPFVSNGGSSMLACWCLLAFIKSADERLSRRQGRDEPENADEGGRAQ